MTIQEFADLLNGREYGQEITVAEVEKAKQLGYIVVMGYSDDSCEVYGAFREEYDCYNGGLIEDERLTKPITAIWCDKELGCAWSYKTDLPHAEFSIYEDDELYCVGLVIDLNSVLKPCPFCGGEGALHKINVNEFVALMPALHSYKVSCLDCQVSTPICDNKKAVINLWNRRRK